MDAKVEARADAKIAIRSLRKGFKALQVVESLSHQQV